MAKILLIDPDKTSQSAIRELLQDHTIDVFTDAESAVQSAAKTKPDLVIMELALKNHSGMEFLYEFRSYTDWIDIPVIIYSSLRLESEILSSRSWRVLSVYEYMYKPDSTLLALRNAAQKALN